MAAASSKVKPAWSCTRYVARGRRTGGTAVATPAGGAVDGANASDGGTALVYRALVTTAVAEPAAPAHPPLGRWLAGPTNARGASETAATRVAGLPDLLDDDAISGAVRQTIIERVRAVPAAPLLARGLEIGIEEGQHRVVVDAVLARAG